MKTEPPLPVPSAAIPMAVAATPVQLARDSTVEQAFQAIALNCLGQVRANEVGVAERRDVESVHQLRVGLRRLRCAFDLFAPVLALPGHLRGELNWIAAELGTARDWDVLSGSTLPALAGAAPPDMPLADVQHAARACSEERRAAAARALGSKRYARMTLHLSGWIEGGGWRDTLTPRASRHLAAPLAPFARAVLRHAQRRLARRAAALRGAGAKARHQLRIAAKKARYAAEFFQSLYSQKRARRHLAALSALQDALGRLNDAAVGARLLRSLRGSAAHLAAHASRVRRHLARCSRTDTRQIGRLWRRFAALKTLERGTA